MMPLRKWLRRAGAVFKNPTFYSVLLGLFLGFVVAQGGDLASMISHNATWVTTGEGLSRYYRFVPVFVVGLFLAGLFAFKEHEASVKQEAAQKKILDTLEKIEAHMESQKEMLNILKDILKILQEDRDERNNDKCKHRQRGNLTP